MKHKPEIEIMARGVLVQDGKLLVCQTKGSPIFYLPGGHIEFAESAAASLAREIKEELGVATKVGRFLGVVEHTFLQTGIRHCEVNLVFAIRCPALDPRSKTASCEDYIRFAWLPLKTLRRSRLEPWPLQDLLPQWLRSRRGAARLGSTYSRG